MLGYCYGTATGTDTVLLLVLLRSSLVLTL